MLVELAIENLGVIERVNLSMGSGFTALTGETGAGISLASGWRRERNTSFIHNSQ